MAGACFVTVRISDQNVWLKCSSLLLQADADIVIALLTAGNLPSTDGRAPLTMLPAYLTGMLFGEEGNAKGGQWWGPLY